MFKGRNLRPFLDKFVLFNGGVFYFARLFWIVPVFYRQMCDTFVVRKIESGGKILVLLLCLLTDLRCTAG